MKIVKLDTRFTGHGYFTHYVSSVSKMSRFSPPYSGIELFLQWRNWLWEVYGPGAEIGLYPVARKFDPNIYLWGWDTRAEHDTRFAKNRLYFTKEEYLSAFLLQWDVK